MVRLNGLNTLVCAMALAAGLGTACGGDDSGGGGKGSGGTPSGGGTGGKGGAGGSDSGTGATGGGATGGTGGGGTGGGGTGGAAGGAAYQKLSETGLYSDISTGAIAADVVEFRPRYQLWSDDAEKKRWVYLPPGSKIDTSDMDYWVYPVGMKLWKEFTRGGKRIETRLIEKTAADTWYVMAFQWDAAGTDATAVPTGVPDESGPNDIPSQANCEECHDKMKDHVLSFSAIQLSHNLGGLNLQNLIDQSRLTAAPAGPFTLPGTTTDQDALGYLHANCGPCHNENSFVFATVNMQLWLKTATLGTVQATSTYTTTVNQPTTGFANPTGKTLRIKPKDIAASDVHFRMSQRGTLTQMPPLASEVVDDTGVAALTAWINSL